MNRFNKPIDYFNIVDDPPLTVKEFVDLIRKVSGKNNFKNLGPFIINPNIVANKNMLKAIAKVTIIWLVTV